MHTKTLLSFALLLSVSTVACGDDGSNDSEIIDESLQPTEGATTGGSQDGPTTSSGEDTDADTQMPSTNTDTAADTDTDSTTLPPNDSSDNDCATGGGDCCDENPNFCDPGQAACRNVASVLLACSLIEDDDAYVQECESNRVFDAPECELARVFHLRCMSESSCEDLEAGTGCEEEADAQVAACDPDAVRLQQCTDMAEARAECGTPESELENYVEECVAMLENGDDTCQQEWDAFYSCIPGQASCRDDDLCPLHREEAEAACGVG